MSYARFSGDCDVYVFEHCQGWWQIYAVGGGDFQCASPGECADKLEELRADGRQVPQYAIDALREEEAADPDAAPAPSQDPAR